MERMAPGGVPLEVVAAITAALSMVLGEGQFTLRSIAPLEEPPAPGPGASAWAMAGRLEQHLSRQHALVRHRRQG
ncbi:MAG: hypothetical protein L6E13_04535 [Firmicutes bacterium]|nr:hypothetical protein [Bacillota bacterium]